MTIQTPIHIEPVHHLHRVIRCACEAVADRAVDLILDVNPVWKDNVRRQLIHPVPRNPLSCLNIFDDLEGLRPLTHGVRRVAGPAEFDIRDSRNPFTLYKAVAKGAVQMSHLLVMDVVETDRLVNGGRRKRGKEGEKKTFCPDLESLKSNDAQEKNQDDSKGQNDPLFHNLYAM